LPAPRVFFVVLVQNFLHDHYVAIPLIAVVVVVIIVNVAIAAPHTGAAPTFSEPPFTRRSVPKRSLQATQTDTSPARPQEERCRISHPQNRPAAALAAPTSGTLARHAAAAHEHKRGKEYNEKHHQHCHKDRHGARSVIVAIVIVDVEKEMGRRRVPSSQPPKSAQDTGDPALSRICERRASFPASALRACGRRLRIAVVTSTLLNITATAVVIQMVRSHVPPTPAAPAASATP
jgi:hypothetical protein